MSDKTKTAEEIWNRVSTAYNPEWSESERIIYAMEEYKNQELTQQQSAYAELKKQNAELVDDLNLKIQDLNRQIPRYNDIAEGHRFQGKIELYQDAKTTAIVYGQIANQLKELISKHTT